MFKIEAIRGPAKFEQFFSTMSEANSKSKELVSYGFIVTLTRTRS